MRATSPTVSAGSQLALECTALDRTSFSIRMTHDDSSQLVLICIHDSSVSSLDDTRLGTEDRFTYLSSQDTRGRHLRLFGLHRSHAYGHSDATDGDRLGDHDAYALHGHGRRGASAVYMGQAPPASKHTSTPTTGDAASVLHVRMMLLHECTACVVALFAPRINEESGRAGSDSIFFVCTLFELVKLLLSLNKVDHWNLVQ